MIELSVGIPMFRAKYCGWIALEGLIRQEGIDFDWELVVAEEINMEPFTKKRIMEYQSRLKEVGCVKITYIPLKKWLYLSNKIALIASKCAKSSKIYASNSADLYSPPNRLKTQYDLMTKEKIDYTSSGRTIVYDIKTENYYLNNSLILFERGIQAISDGTCKSVRMNIMKTLPRLANKRKSIDGWIWLFCKAFKKNKFKPHVDLTTDNWKYGLNVHGLNNLTFGVREKRFKGLKRPRHIIDCPFDIKETIPKEILQRLKDAKQYIPLHKKSRPKWKGYQFI